MAALSTLAPTFVPVGLDTGVWGPGTGDLWLLVLLDHVRVQRAALPPAMEWTSHLLDPICSLDLKTARSIHTCHRTQEPWLVTRPINFPALAS